MSVVPPMGLVLTYQHDLRRRKGNDCIFTCRFTASPCHSCPDTIIHVRPRYLGLAQRGTQQCHVNTAGEGGEKGSHDISAGQHLKEELLTVASTA